MNDRALREDLRRFLSPARFRHTRSVAGLAKSLARRHGVDEGLALRAGLLHDCAKEWSGKRLARYVQTWKIRVPGRAFIWENRRFGLLHAHVSAHWGGRRYGEKDRGVLKAVSGHTLGFDRMGKLDKILYVADFASTDRTYAAATRVRRKARVDLEGAFREAVGWKLFFLVHRKKPIHPQTTRLWNVLWASNRP